MAETRTQESEPLTLTGVEVAELLGVSEATFHVYRTRGYLAGCESGIPGRWSREAIVALARGQRLPSVPTDSSEPE